MSGRGRGRGRGRGGGRGRGADGTPSFIARKGMDPPLLWPPFEKPLTPLRRFTEEDVTSVKTSMGLRQFYRDSPYYMDADGDKGLGKGDHGNSSWYHYIGGELSSTPAPSEALERFPEKTLSFLPRELLAFAKTKGSLSPRPAKRARLSYAPDVTALTAQANAHDEAAQVGEGEATDGQLDYVEGEEGEEYEEEDQPIEDEDGNDYNQNYYDDDEEDEDAA
eukprot:TRINITY_DN7196_c0_g1_i1.p1 TRINITY_DN7196_c0_g1~~TRINITY_DN7196_c0_g1_i1.p1  ORF type:complete len:221 (-),score=28.83 TRINITY_DN7196_c0_g1_i1:119-781(-)